MRGSRWDGAHGLRRRGTWETGGVRLQRQRPPPRPLDIQWAYGAVPTPLCQVAARLVVAPVNYRIELPPDAPHQYHDVVLVEAQDGSFYPAVVDCVSYNGMVLLITLHSYIRGKRFVRFVPEKRVHAATWTFTGYRKRPC